MPCRARGNGARAQNFRGLAREPASTFRNVTAACAASAAGPGNQQSWSATSLLLEQLLQDVARLYLLLAIFAQQPLDGILHLLRLEVLADLLHRIENLLLS